MNAAQCSGNVATVGSTSITKFQYDQLLAYTLAFYERGSPRSSYYGKSICSTVGLKPVCSSIKRNLLQRMIDQQLVSAYAAAHNLIPTSGDWAKALQRENRVVQRAGGQAAFQAYLAKLGTDEAQFRWLESEQMETAKVIRAMGPSRFRPWLRAQESSTAITRCSS